MNNLIIFDMDDTLVGTHELIAASLEHASSEYSCRKLDDSVVAMISGYTLSRVLSQRVPYHYLDTALGRYYGYFKEHFRTTAKIYPSMQETLALLREKGIVLATLTGASRKWAAITLQESKLLKFFSVVLTSDDVRHPKPDPTGIIAIMSQLGVDKEHTSYVGDEVKDIRTSRNASVQSIGALWGSWEKEELTSAADLTFEKPIDLLRILR